MKKLFTILAVAMCSTLTMAQTNQYFWANGNLLMGNSISNIDSITFSSEVEADTLMLLLPKQSQSIVVYNTVTKLVHDTVYIGKNGPVILAEEQGSLKGKFKISDTKHIFISRGNLQYQALTGLWKFAEEQYEIIGDTLGNTGPSPAQSAWMDLFGFGTSNYAAKAYTFATSNASASNYPWDSSIAGSKHDWGIYNAILNGGNIVGLWRAMSRSEWRYLFDNNNSCPATVCGVCGRILFPEDFVMLPEMEELPTASDYTTYQYNSDQWKALEEAGAAFFPAAGYRYGTTVSKVNVEGYYWTTDGYNYGSTDAYYYCLTNMYSYSDDNSRCNGYSVRLVKNAD